MNFADEKIATEIEQILTSSGKMKILRLLMKFPNHTFTRYEIGKKTPLSQKDIARDLDILVKAKWIIEFQLQYLRKYSINLDNELTHQFFEFFKEIKYV